MAIAPLIVSVRTAGAAALARLGASFRRLGAEIRVAYARFALAGGIPGWLRRLPGHVRRASLAFRALAASIGRATRALIMHALASRAAQAASDRTARGLAMMATQVALLGAKLAVVVALLPALVGIFGNIVPAIMLIAPAAASAGLAVLGLKLALNGMSEALQAGLSGDTEEFEKALSKLAPSAAHVVRTLVQLRDEWKPLAKEFQQRVFEGAGDELKSLSKLIKPIADTWLPRLADRFGEVRHQLADGLARFAADGRLESVWRNIHIAVSNLLRVVFPLARAFGDILEVAAPRFAQLAVDIGILAGKFSDWIRGAKESGKLGEWLDKALDTLGKLKTIAGNVIGIFQAMFSAGEDDGQALLDRLITITEQTERWLKSADGQAFLNLFNIIASGFAFISPFFQYWIGYMEAVGVSARFLGTVFSALWDGLKAAAAAVFGAIVGHLYGVLVAAEKALGWIPGIGPKLRQAKAAFEDYARGVQNSLDSIPDQTVVITYRAQRIGPHMMSGSQLSGSYSSGIGGRAVGGPMRAGVMYQINEQGQEFIQLGTSGRAYNKRESDGMMGGGNWLPAPTNAARGLLRAIEKAQRQQVRGRARGSSQRYLGSAAIL